MTDTDDKKQVLYQFCCAFIDNRVARIQSEIKEVQNALGSETKSSAGDKHETGRAMLQLEREKLGQQLAEAEKTQQLMDKVPYKTATSHIGLGSWTKTSNGSYFIAISAGEHTINGMRAYCISAQTPIGQLVLGKKVGDTFSFRGELIYILEIK